MRRKRTEQPNKLHALVTTVKPPSAAQCLNLYKILFPAAVVEPRRSVSCTGTAEGMGMGTDADTNTSHDTGTDMGKDKSRE